MCKYAYYDSNEKIRQKIYCRQTGKTCLYSKYCVKVGKFIPSDGMENCFMALKEIKKVPNGANRVRFVKRGYLYVEIGDKVVKIKNDKIGEADFVYARQKDGAYEASLNPFVEEVVIVEEAVDNDTVTEEIVEDTDTEEIETEVDTEETDVEEDTEAVEIEEDVVVEDDIPKKKRTYNRKRK